MPRIKVRDGHELHVRVLGRGSDVVLLHGFASDGRSWLPFVAPFLHRHRFLVPDLRGFGLSHHAPLAGCPLTRFAEDLEDVLAALQVERAALVGISMGAFTALQSFKLHGGARFSRYLHIDQGPVIHNRDGYPHGLLGDQQAAFFARLRTLLDALDERLHEASYDALPRPLRAEFWQLLGEFSAAAFSAPRMQALVRKAAQHEPLMRRLMPVARWQIYPAIVRAYLERDYDLRDAFGHIRVPLTVLIGGASRMYPPAGQRTIATLAPHARIRELRGAGHMLPYEAPRRFLRELRAFLA